MEKKAMIEVGEFISKTMKDKERYLRRVGKIEGKKRLSNAYIAKEVLGISNTWFSAILKGEKEANDEILVMLADYFDIEESELFRRARRVPPSVLEEFKKEYLGDYYGK